MEKFSYIATDKDHKKVQGQIEAISQVQAQAILRSKKLFIIELKKIEVKS